jgi:hypothetical protein
MKTELSTALAAAGASPNTPEVQSVNVATSNGNGRLIEVMMTSIIR